MTHPRWLDEAGEPTPRLVRFYHVISLTILLTGLTLTLDLLYQWIRLYKKVNIVIRSFLWVSIADLLMLLIWVPSSITALVREGVRDDIYCQVTAVLSFVSFWSVGASHVVAANHVTLFVQGVKMSPLRATLHNLFAIGLAIVYASIVGIYDQLGVYRRLFCTTKNGSIVLLVTVLQLVSCLSLLCWQAYVTHRDIVRVDEKAVDLMSESMTARRSRASRIIFGYLSRIITIFAVAHSAAGIVALLGILGTPYPPLFDLVAAWMFKMNAVLDSLYLRRMLGRMILGQAGSRFQLALSNETPLKKKLTAKLAQALEAAKVKPEPARANKMVLQRGRTGNNDDEDDEAITNSWVQHVFAQDDASVAPEKPRQVALGTRIAGRGDYELSIDSDFTFASTSTSQSYSVSVSVNAAIPVQANANTIPQANTLPQANADPASNNAAAKSLPSPSHSRLLLPPLRQTSNEPSRSSGSGFSDASRPSRPSAPPLRPSDLPPMEFMGPAIEENGPADAIV